MGDHRKVSADARPREGAPPSPERLEALARAVAEGAYRVPAHRIADAMIRSLRADRPARRD